MAEAEQAAPDAATPGLEALLARNADWSRRMTEADGDYFPRLAAAQTPAFFWIGCADSRVPANIVSGLVSGEVFVQRNVANLVHDADMNLQSTLEFAVEALGIREIIVCGHYGCGGVKAAAAGALPQKLADHWLEPIRRLARVNRAELDGLSGEARTDRLAELNVLDGVARLAETPVVRRVWSRGERLWVHGLIYGLSDGRLRNLGCSVGEAPPE